MKILGYIVLFAVVGSMSFSLFHMSTHSETHTGMTDCPFMAHNHDSICPMTLSDHLGAWKMVFTATIPSLTMLWAAMVAVAVLLVSHFFIPKRKLIPIRLILFPKQSYSFSFGLLQELFARGILHPKLF